MIEKKAYGKVNLGLDIIGRREDGYHLVRMVMQSVDVFDVLTFEKISSDASERDGAKYSVETERIGVNENADVAEQQNKKPEIIITATNDPSLSLGEDNLIYKAARLLMDKYKIADGVKISLTKNIPIAAGMAGGSSDCAATLKGINELFELGLSEEELREYGVTLGADVPYCIMRGTALAEGIGEKLSSLPPMVKCPVLIAKPAVSVSTKFVYQNLKLNEQTPHPDIDALITDIRNSDLDNICADMGNVLETVTIPNYPVIAQIKEQMLKSGAKASMMSGSGPTVFGLFGDEETARRARAEMKASGLAKQVYLTSIYNNRR